VQYSLVEKDKKRYIVFSDPESGPEFIRALPKSVIYKFEGKQLILTIEDGQYKGDYKLDREQEKRQKGSGVELKAIEAERFVGAIRGR
jgi:hypothetical protein